MSRIFEALQRANPELTPSISQNEGGAPRFSELTATISNATVDDTPRFVIPRSADARIVAWTNPNCAAVEQLRFLASRIRHAQQRRPLKKLLVTSPTSGDGKSTSSINLAITLASQGHRTLLVDGDLHQSALAKILSVDGTRGWATSVEDSADVTNLLYRAETLPLWFLPAGFSCEQPLKLVQSSKTCELLQELEESFSWIVIDSPPVVSLADSGIWATLSDAVLLVLREGFTPKKALTKCLESIDHAKLFGVIINDSSAKAERYYSGKY